ncbi:tetratricopeptide repeat protein [Nannocystaceae bacterium ST9]
MNDDADAETVMEALSLGDGLAPPAEVGVPDPSRGPIPLGRHVLLSTLGRGGMGVVYAAYDERLDRNVAIKVLQRQRREKDRLRLIREAQVLARLSHPNVVQIYEICESEQTDYLVMELVEGETLAQWLTAPRSIPEILAVFLAAGRGLVAAHAKGVVHRDFKPSNVMLRNDGQALVMDFGLARDERVRGGDNEAGDPPDGGSNPELDSRRRSGSSSGRRNQFEEALTRAGTVMGTVGYVAPEQLLGKVADARSDQFSFCVALWEAILGRRPFAGKDMRAYQRAVFKGKPARGSGSMPRWIRRILERGLALEPDRRWPSMQALLDALQRDPTRRRWGWVGVGTLSGLLLAAVVGTMALRERERERMIATCDAESRAIEVDWNVAAEARIERAFLATRSDSAVSAWRYTRSWLAAYASDWQHLRREACMEARVEHTRSEVGYADIEACLAERRTNFVEMIEVLANSDKSMIQQAALAAAQLPPLSHCTNDALLARDLAPPEDMREEIIELKRRLGRVTALGLVGDSDGALAEALAVAGDAERLGWLPVQAEAWLAVAQRQYALGEHAPAREAGERAFRLAAIAGDELGMLDAATQMISMGADETPLDPAIEWGRAGELLVAQLGLEGSIFEGQLLVESARMLLKQGKYDEARDHGMRALEILESKLGPNHPSVGNALYGLGSVYFRQSNYDEAIAVWRRQLASIEQAAGPESPRLIGVLNNLGAATLRMRDTEGALAYLRRSLAITEGTLGPEHPKAALALGNIGSLLLERGDYDAALSHLRRALVIQEASSGPNHTNVALVLDLIADVLSAKGEGAAAMVEHRRALAIFESTLGPDHPELIGPYAHMGDTLHDLADYEASAETFRHALQLGEAAGKPDDIEFVGYPLLGLGRAQIGLGQLDEAERNLERLFGLPGDDTRLLRERARFQLGRVDWARGDSVRARERIVAARDALLKLGKSAGLTEAEAWLAEHP